MLNVKAIPDKNGFKVLVPKLFKLIWPMCIMHWFGIILD